MPHYEYDKDYPFAAFITNLGKYNEGDLVGEWVKFPTTPEEMQKVFERIGIGQKDDFGQPYEEWFITDYDCYVDGLYYVDEPKTKKGARQIPMSEKVCQALKRAVKNRGKAAPVNIGGYTNFLFLNQSGLPKTASCYESMFQGLVRKYNKHHKPEEALPNITPHTMRHTFCTRLAHAGMNPKDLQYIMGHSNITMTLNYYAHADYASAKAAMDRLAA